ncbi:MAG: hypothetical protein IJ011_09395 [Clostridia bacterium]|nr:hypothetical protein [Clostridia bacterium]
MKNYTLKALSIILSLLMLSAALASCSKDKDESKDSQTEKQTTADVTDSETDTKSAAENTGLEIRDYNGASMNIWYSKGTATWGPQPLKVTADEATADKISKAGYTRNAVLEEMLGVYIDYTVSDTNPNKSDDSSATKELQRLYNAGDTAKYDIIITGTRACGALAQEGRYYDLSESDYIHPDAYYYEAQVNEQMKVYDSMYYTCGFFSTGNTRALCGVYTNKSILDEATNGQTDMEDLYELAFENEWTLEKMLEYGKLWSTPVDNANNWTDTGASYAPNGWNSYENAHYAFTIGGGNARLLYYALGGTVIEQNASSGEYEVTLDNSVNTNLVTYILEQMGSNGADTAYLSDTTFIKSFTEGHTMFMMSDFASIDAANGIANTANLEWGLMPAPLYEAGNEYKAYSDSWVMVFAGIPSANRDLDKATYLYEMFMAYSYDYLYPAYYEDTFGTTYQPDASSAQVFDIIANSRTVCFRDVYQIGGSTILDNHRALLWGKGSIGDITTMATTLRGSLNTFITELDNMG